RSNTRTSYPFALSAPPVFRRISDFGSQITREQLPQFKAFGIAYDRLLPAPEPPITSTLVLRLCLCPSIPIWKCWVKMRFCLGFFLSLYFLAIWNTSPHLAEPCSSPRRRFF